MNLVRRLIGGVLILKKLNFEIYLTFFKIGMFTFGGGYAMLPLIEKEMVESKKWIDEEEIVDVLALSQTMPGAIALNCATLIGYRLGGHLTSLFAMLGVITPSIILLTLIALFFNQFLDQAIIKAIFMGIRSGIVALIIKAGIRIAKAAVQDRLTLFLCACSIVGVVFINISPIILIVTGGLIGFMIYRLYPNWARKVLERGHS